MSIILIISFLLVPASILSACGKEALGASYKPGTPTSYVTLNYNPSVELIADQKHKVIAINAVNDEAGLLFFNKDYRGYSVDVVIREMVKVMAQTGYIQANSEETADAVFVSVYSLESAIKQEVYTKIKQTTENYFVQNGQYAIVAETDFDDMLKSYALKFSSIGSTNTEGLARFRLALKAMEYDVDLDFYDAMSLTSTKLLAKIYEEVKLIGQIQTKAQKTAYLNERAVLKQALRNDLKTIYNNPDYTNLYNELEVLREEYRTTTDLAYANGTLKNLIKEKETDLYNREKTLRSAKLSQVLTREQTYKQEKLDLLYDKVQISLENPIDYASQLFQKKEEFKASFEERVNYAKSNSYLWQGEYETWKPMTQVEIRDFLTTIKTKVDAIKVSTRTDVARAISRINPYTRSFGFGASTGGTFVLGQ